MPGKGGRRRSQDRCCPSVQDVHGESLIARTPVPLVSSWTVAQPRLTRHPGRLGGLCDLPPNSTRPACPCTGVKERTGHLPTSHLTQFVNAGSPTQAGQRPLLGPVWRRRLRSTRTPAVMGGTARSSRNNDGSGIGSAYKRPVRIREKARVEGKGASFNTVPTLKTGGLLMQPDAVHRRLEALSTIAAEDKPVNGLFRLLASPVIWEMAYASIRTNKGAMTPGVDGLTIEALTPDRIRSIIDQVMTGTYRFAPARRVYIPKPNGGKRPLGIPTADDKLVQSACRLILERIYEPVFSDRSFGFRPDRSCLTALSEIKHTWNGAVWLIEADLRDCFGSFNHRRLLALLAQRVQDKKFLHLIGGMLKAGYLEDWQYHRTFSGTPQGGVISPSSPTSTSTNSMSSWRGSSGSTRAAPTAPRTPSTPGWRPGCGRRATSATTCRQTPTRKRSPTPTRRSPISPGSCARCRPRTPSIRPTGAPGTRATPTTSCSARSEPRKKPSGSRPRSPSSSPNSISRSRPRRRAWSRARTG